MSSIATSERECYTEVWNSVDRYGDYSPGERYLPVFLEMTKTTMRGSVLDAGCGSGKGSLALQMAGFTVMCCDITDEGLVPEAKGLPFRQVVLWNDIRKTVGFHDWVVCSDVLEHIPTEYTMLVISRLLEVARRGVFLSIALVPDQFGVWVGQSLHKTVEPFAWWRDRLADMGRLVEARDLLSNGLYLVAPK